jgi:pimeloyl-ACP methyl ester carboxylesterase
VEELRLAAGGLGFRCLADGPVDGPLVLLLHGFPEGAEAWSAQLPALAAAGYRAVALDMRGYGGSDCPDGLDAYAMAELRSDVAGALDALDAERCHLVGHDWGALVGWSFASYRGDRLVTWSALSVGHPDAFAGAIAEDEDQARRSAYIGLFRDVDRAERVLLEDGMRRLRALYRVGPTPDAIPSATVDAYLRVFAQPGRLRAGLSYYAANLNREAAAASPPAPHPVQVPSQLLWGDADPAVGRAPTERTAALVAGEYRLRVLAGAGHWLASERPEEVTRLLLEWFRGRPGQEARRLGRGGPTSV